MDGYIENLYVNRELYSVLFEPVCSKYKLTLTEMLILIFLSKNTEYDTASDIVEQLKITKSHVSASVRDLSERGYLEGGYEGHNHRTIHLRLCDRSMSVIREGEHVQDKFLTVVSQGFTEEEKIRLKNYIQRMNHNANQYLKACDNIKRR